MSGQKFEFGDKVLDSTNSTRPMLFVCMDGDLAVVASEDEEFIEVSLANLTPYTPPPPPNTVPVRVAVAVAADRTWDAEGASFKPPESSESVAIGSLNPGIASRITWITAYAYLPEPPAEVRGEVQP